MVSSAAVRNSTEKNGKEKVVINRVRDGFQPKTLTIVVTGPIMFSGLPPHPFSPSYTPTYTHFLN